MNAFIAVITFFAAIATLQTGTTSVSAIPAPKEKIYPGAFCVDTGECRKPNSGDPVDWVAEPDAKDSLTLIDSKGNFSTLLPNVKVDDQLYSITEVHIAPHSRITIDFDFDGVRLFSSATGHQQYTNDGNDGRKVTLKEPINSKKISFTRADFSD